MKRTKTVSKFNKKLDKSSEPSMTCSCQILNDTSLSNVGDSDCDCSECLEAHLEAFNQLKQVQVKTNHTTRQLNQNHNKGRDKQYSQTRFSDKNDSKSNINRHRSSDIIPNQKKTKKRYGENLQSQQDHNKFQQGGHYTNGQINDFLLITRYRTRKYLEERKKLKEKQKLQRDILKQKIKRNLQILKYTSQQMRQGDGNKASQHPYKWNHSKYKCQCNGKAQKHKCYQRTKSKLDTNLDNLKQNFSENRDEILEQRKRMRQQQRKQRQMQKCPHDHCPDHHNKTDKNKIKQIQQFILKNVKKYKKNQKKLKKQQQQSKNIRQGKLRAIQIKSKQILGRSKKYDNDITKSSFRLSIENFDTFSQLRQQNQRKKKIKQDQIKIKKAIKQGGGQLQNKIYEFQEQDQQDQIYAQNIINERKTLQNAPEYRNQKEIFDRIAYDANLKVPTQLNKKVTKSKKDQTHKHSPRQAQKQKQQKKQRTQKNLSKGKQEQAKKRIQEQILRKKKQIMNEYQKRNTNKPLNHDVRKQYEQKISNKAGNKNKPKKQYQDPIIQELGTLNQGQKIYRGMKGPKGEDMNMYQQNYHNLSAKKTSKKF